YTIAHSGGTGLLSQGTRDWVDYQVSATVRSHLMTAGGIAARVQGINRYYALLLGDDGKARLVKRLDEDTVLAEADCDWQSNVEYQLTLRVEGSRLQGWVNDQALFDVQDSHQPLQSGGIALLCADGSIMADVVSVKPV